MDVLADKRSLTNFMDRNRGKKSTVGFVPTMGALHNGHLSLVSRSLSENDITLVSIFVNPTQFDNPSDLENYPRNLDSDLKLLSSLSDEIVVFAPEAGKLYGGKVKSEHFSFGGIEFEMEGKLRTGHFDGVGTILSILFSLVSPTRAYFGEKDFQQLQIVKKLVEIRKFPVIVKGCPIVREPNGLAMSSRNRRLTKNQFEEAAIIHRTLQEVRQNFRQKTISELTTTVKERFLNSEYLDLEYFEIVDESTLKTAIRRTSKRKYRAFIAAYCGKVRLIDNMALN